MSDFRRYAVYYLPPDGAFADFGAQWLGWDVARGHVHSHRSDLIEMATRRPRKYGFHATLKAPFELAQTKTRTDLQDSVARLAEGIAPVALDGLAVTRLGRFLALCPTAPSAALQALAAACVTELDGMRAPLTQADIDRRRASRLTPEQDALMLKWGYPYVLDQFRFHMTLTGPLNDAASQPVRKALDIALPKLPRPFVLDQIAIAGEAADGRFHLVSRHPLLG